MSQIEFKNVRHAYPPPAGQAPVYALKEVSQVWERRRRLRVARPFGLRQNNPAEHHLGLADAVRGIDPVRRERGHRLPTAERHIAQVFQFPVVYDTMTVYDNLAFPLRNRRHAEAR